MGEARIRVTAADTASPVVQAFEKNTTTSMKGVEASAARAAAAFASVTTAAQRTSAAAGTMTKSSSAAREGIVALGSGGERAVKGLEKANSVAIALSGGLSGLGAKTAMATSGLAQLVLSGFNPAVLAMVAVSASLGVLISKSEEAAAAARAHKEEEVARAEAISDLNRKIEERRTGTPSDILKAREDLKKAEADLAARRANANSEGKVFLKGERPPGLDAFSATEMTVKAQEALVRHLRETLALREKDRTLAQNQAIGAEASASAAKDRAAAEKEVADLRARGLSDAEAAEATFAAMEERLRALRSGVSADEAALQGQLTRDARAFDALRNSGLGDDDPQVKAAYRKMEATQGLLDLTRQLAKVEKERTAAEAKKAKDKGDLDALLALIAAERERYDAATLASQASLSSMEDETALLKEMASVTDSYTKSLIDLREKEKAALGMEGLTDAEKDRIRRTFAERRDLINAEAAKERDLAFADASEAAAEKAAADRYSQVVAPFDDAAKSAGDTFGSTLVTEANRAVMDRKVDLANIGTTMGTTIISGFMEALVKAAIGDTFTTLFTNLFHGASSFLFPGSGGGGGGGGGGGVGLDTSPRLEGVSVFASESSARPVVVNMINEPPPVVAEEVFNALPPEKRRGYTAQAQAPTGRRGR